MGGAISSQVGEGGAVAVILGAVIGAVIGHEIGRNLDDQDRGCIGDPLKYSKDGQSVRWVKESCGVAYVVKPVGGARNAGTCRDSIASLTRWQSGIAEEPCVPYR